ncbi:hypothetical protein GCM10011351_10370 [Paraliobacillus quinghaiensis]|uniref:DUF4247 domain-containing protein n=1 Tax=Paraliobacillus quinghaiensis TaxID=470815 RepID=A0A917TL61_9BACI|nr:DUF4247 domain-containing protein [Paraliobacillus quinghaiensis]GGM26552.1 hypothetical protein GCM10011351_10370 [Paraliobacillus quinghaiensis]
MKRIVPFFSIIMALIFLSACGETEPASVDEIPSEPSQAELTDQLKRSTTYDVETLMSDNFYLLDTVVADREEANIYATKQFTVEEIVDVVSETIEPDEISEKKDNQRILIYPNHFVTFKQSEEDSQVTLIEVATDTFVRNNYSPNYLNGFFTYIMLDRMLSTNNWGQNRQNKCSGGSCYGGYTTGQKTFGGGVTTNRTNRGLSSIRGGGPSAGK